MPRKGRRRRYFLNQKRQARCVACGSLNRASPLDIGKGRDGQLRSREGNCDCEKLPWGKPLVGEEAETTPTHILKLALTAHLFKVESEVRRRSSVGNNPLPWVPCVLSFLDILHVSKYSTSVTVLAMPHFRGDSHLSY